MCVCMYNLSVLLVFWKAAAKDDDGILDLEQFLLQNAECCIVLGQYQQVTALTVTDNQTHTDINAPSKQPAKLLDIIIENKVTT